MSRAKNVEYRAQNSLNLTTSSQRFDLIWVDGAHGYPFIACDITNSVRMLKQDGFLMVDDVWTEISRSDTHYRSIGGYETIKALHEAGAIAHFNLYYKRLDGTYNYPGAQKYVALAQKPR